MPAAVRKKPPGLLEKLRNALFAAPETANTQDAAGAGIASPVLPSGLQSTPEQQRELEALFTRLFTNQSLVTSGRLQMLGFDKIKAKLGDDWPLMQAAIYNIADEVIRTHKTEGDIYLRYRDDTYVLIFPNAGVEEGWARATLIADEIGKRLAQLGNDPLRIIQIEPHVCAVEGKAAAGKSLSAALEKISSATAADVARKRAAQASAGTTVRPPVCRYHPLWSVKGKALSAYLCELEEKAAASAFERDLKTLTAAGTQLNRLKEKGDPASLFVPVRHGTLFNRESCEKYMAVLREVPEALRQNIQLLVVNYMEGLPQDRAFWFLGDLKNLSRGVFVEMPMRTKANFALLKAQGVENLALSVETGIDEAVIFNYLEQFTGMARDAGLQQVVGFNLPSLSLVTSSTCMGFAFLGGPAIHAAVAAPETSLRFRYADLFTRS